jgi:Uma2 family endonuclease
MAPPGLSIDERVEVPSSVFDHTGFRRWATSDVLPDDVRVSYANGEVLLEMSRPELETHSKVKGELTSVLVQLVKVEDRGETYPDRALLTNEAAELSTEPDFVFVSWGAFEAGRVRLVPKANRPDDFIEIEGTPDLVIEVVSDSSKRKDTELLRAAYARAGVPEYWLVDTRSASLSFVILHLLRPEHGAPASRRWCAPVSATQHEPPVDRATPLTASTPRALHRASAPMVARSHAGEGRHVFAPSIGPTRTSQSLETTPPHQVSAMACVLNWGDGRSASVTRGFAQQPARGSVQRAMVGRRRRSLAQLVWLSPRSRRAPRPYPIACLCAAAPARASRRDADATIVPSASNANATIVAAWVPRSLAVTIDRALARRPNGLAPRFACMTRR